MFGLRRRQYKRPAQPGDVCTCGRPAAVVFRSPAFGEVGSCLSLDPAKPIRPCVFCGTTGTHAGSVVCPAYRVRPEWAVAGYDADTVAELWSSGQLVGVAD